MTGELNQWELILLLKCSSGRFTRSVLPSIFAGFIRQCDLHVLTDFDFTRRVQCIQCMQTFEQRRTHGRERKKKITLLRPCLSFPSTMKKLVQVDAKTTLRGRAKGVTSSFQQQQSLKSAFTWRFIFYLFIFLLNTKAMISNCITVEWKPLSNISGLFFFPPGLGHSVGFGGSRNRS